MNKNRLKASTLVSFILFALSNNALVSGFTSNRCRSQTSLVSGYGNKSSYYSTTEKNTAKNRNLKIITPCLSMLSRSKASACKHDLTQLCRTSTRLHSLRLPTDASSPHVMIMSLISTFFKNFPYISAFIACATKASLADFVAQKRFGNDESTNYNYLRTAAFLLYGGLYQGCVQEHIFNHLFPVWFGTGTSPAEVLKKVVFDMLVLSPFLCLPTAYIAKSFIFRYSPLEATKRYLHDVMHNGLWKKYCLLWFPVNCLTFSIVPEHFRIAWIAAVSFFWMMILSYVSSKNDAYHHSKVSSAASEAEVIADDDFEGCVLVDGVTCAIDG